MPHPKASPLFVVRGMKKEKTENTIDKTTFPLLLRIVIMDFVFTTTHPASWWCKRVRSWSIKQCSYHLRRSSKQVCLQNRLHSCGTDESLLEVKVQELTWTTLPCRTFFWLLSLSLLLFTALRACAAHECSMSATLLLSDLLKGAYLCSP